jgi:hypothetical protein
MDGMTITLGAITIATVTALGGYTVYDALTYEPPVPSCQDDDGEPPAGHEVCVWDAGEEGRSYVSVMTEDGKDEIIVYLD